MEYTVGIVTYERPESIGSPLDSLLSQTRLPDELLIVDDSDSSRTTQVVESFRPKFEAAGVRLSYTRRSGGRSMPGARNDIIEAATGDVVCFIDDDVVCEESWLAAIDDGYSRDDVAAVCGPAIRTDQDLMPTDTRITDQTNRNTISEYGEVNEISHCWIPPSPVETEAGRGANMSFRISALEAIGGFDTRYEGPAVFEEWDVMARLKQRGFDLLYQPEATVYHFETEEGGARTDDNVRPTSYWYAKNSLLFRRKNFRETFYRSVALLFFVGTSQLPPIWRRIAALVALDTSQIAWLKGYWHGLSANTA
ncbi:glycosyltransferase family 2 protein [Haloarcula salinisoli]|uniref:Glycosyltransferase n=1 Tax=Haloarcula salinisoli TaxID=2487746 RepID=A0A8J7YHD0_9EURY|nr:glycosyltransferase [Halomicroarcula salinisoli]MBX0288605.1 glycosyltransferase [Halomicroarcula salinisoli]MBX0306015.1 glycosyltransferase [Halomicroarcula salinisoli]